MAGAGNSKRNNYNRQFRSNQSYSAHVVVCGGNDIGIYIYDKTKQTKQNDDNEVMKYNYPMILLERTIIQIFLTGLVGAGGGFLIIPALVLLAKMPMKISRWYIIIYYCCKIFNRFYWRSARQRNYKLAYSWWIYISP